MRCVAAACCLALICAIGHGDGGPGPGQAQAIASHLGHVGPAFAAGVRPSTLGWGDDDRAYPGQFVVNPRDGAELAWIPAGEFRMGTPPEQVDRRQRDRYQDEQPVHLVRIGQGFWMYRHEVTNEQYRRFRPEHSSGEFRGLSINADRMPVASLTWEDAQAYCGWAGVRLPTEAQWEYACRAGGSTRFTWGDDEREAGAHANVSDITAKAKWSDFEAFSTDDGIAVATAVGMFAPNEWGLHDMLGNVWEWCADWYAADYYERSPASDPTGPEDGMERSLRGGSWFTGPEPTRCTNRFHYYPADTCQGRGFRACVMP